MGVEEGRISNYVDTPWTDDVGPDSRRFLELQFGLTKSQGGAGGLCTALVFAVLQEKLAFGATVIPFLCTS
jgi:hypothetical protein